MKHDPYCPTPDALELVRVPVEGVDFADFAAHDSDGEYHPQELAGSHIGIADGLMNLRNRLVADLGLPPELLGVQEPVTSKKDSDEAWERFKKKFSPSPYKPLEPRRGRIVDYVSDSVDPDPIDRFEGEYRFLSNFHMEPVTWNDYTYPSSEHAYNASKATCDSDHMLIASTLYPYSSKQVARTLPIRSDWDTARLPVMESILRAKFADPGLKARLLATGDRKLVEGNWWGDRFWGRCLGTGENNLGRLLMKLRGEYAAEAAADA